MGTCVQTLQIQLLIYQHLSEHLIVSSILPLNSSSIVTMNLEKCLSPYKRIPNKFNAIIRYYACLFKFGISFCSRCSNGMMLISATVAPATTMMVMVLVLFSTSSAFEIIIMALRYASSPFLSSKQIRFHCFDEF